jgi:hypothetical protein
MATGTVVAEQISGVLARRPNTRVSDGVPRRGREVLHMQYAERGAAVSPVRGAAAVFFNAVCCVSLGARTGPLVPSS